MSSIIDKFLNYGSENRHASLNCSTVVYLVV